MKPCLYCTAIQRAGEGRLGTGRTALSRRELVEWLCLRTGILWHREPPVSRRSPRRVARLSWYCRSVLRTIGLRSMKGERTELATLFSVGDPRGLRVICTDERFFNHILGESDHSELRGREDLLRSAIEEPFSIYRDADDASREIYYRPSELPAPLNRGYLRVVVEFRGRRRAARIGYVITAYHSSSGPKKGEVILWPNA